MEKYGKYFHHFALTLNILKQTYKTNKREERNDVALCEGCQVCQHLNLIDIVKHNIFKTLITRHNSNPISRQGPYWHLFFPAKTGITLEVIISLDLNDKYNMSTLIGCYWSFPPRSIKCDVLFCAYICFCIWAMVKQSIGYIIKWLPLSINMFEELIQHRPFFRIFF